MKYFFSFLLLAFFSFNIVSAQEKHFVFIQSDTKQPFYVSLNGKIYSSTAMGYVIIPKLTEGEYNVTIGFPNNIFPEQGFKYTVNQRDLGFSLKNFGEKGWGLTNLQSQTVLMAGEATPSSIAIANVEKPKEEYRPEISFERKKDTLVVAKVETKASDTLTAITSGSTPITSRDTTTLPATTVVSSVVEQVPTPVVQPETEQPVKQNNKTKAAVSKNSKVKKVAEVKGDRGVYITYVDSDEKNTDTVQLIIPKADPKQASSNESAAINTSTPTNESANKTTDLQFLNMEMSSSKKDSSTVTNTSPETGSLIVNSNCTNLASESDYSKLRRKMALQTTDEAKISEARKIFKNKCFTTSQLKALSTLFPSDEGRYRFFDVSYNFVTDVQLYSSLEKEFIDPYYISRFKAMLRK